MMLWFETDSITGKISTICIMYSNDNREVVRSVSTLASQICELIDPWDYVISAENRKEMLAHMDIGGSDMKVRVLTNNNNTRVEKLACNAMGLPLSMLRFSKTDDQSLEDYAADLFVKSVGAPFAEGLAIP